MYILVRDPRSAWQIPPDLSGLLTVVGRRCRRVFRLRSISQGCIDLWGIPMLEFDLPLVALHLRMRVCCAGREKVWGRVAMPGSRVDFLSGKGVMMVINGKTAAEVAGSVLRRAMLSPQITSPSLGISRKCAALERLTQAPHQDQESFDSNLRCFFR